jgi:hypothetical protein
MKKPLSIKSLSRQKDMRIGYWKNGKSMKRARRNSSHPCGAKVRVPDERAMEIAADIFEHFL